MKRLEQLWQTEHQKYMVITLLPPPILPPPLPLPISLLLFLMLERWPQRTRFF